MTEKRFKQVGVCFIDKFDTKISYCCANEIDCKNIVGKLNELDTKYIDEFNLRETLQQELQRVEEENEQLKKQLASINRLIDNKIDEFKKGDYGDLPCNTIHMFLDLKQELGDLK